MLYCEDCNYCRQESNKNLTTQNAYPSVEKFTCEYTQKVLSLKDIYESVEHPCNNAVQSLNFSKQGMYV